MEAYIQQIFAGGRLRRLPKGQIVIYEGDPITTLYYIISGYVKVYSIVENGSERIIFIYAPGDIFPITSYLSGSATTRYFYECVTDVEFQMIPPEDLRRQIKGNLELGEALMYYADSISQQFLRRIDTLGAADARHKVIALLDFLVEKVGGPEPISTLALPLTAQNMADMCGLTRETVTKKIVSLKREGLVKTTRPLSVDTLRLAKVKQGLGIA